MLPGKLLAKCAQVENIKKKSLTINFPANTSGCGWGENGSFTKDDPRVRNQESIISAFYRLDVPLDIPVVCGLSISSESSNGEEKEFYYDDEIYLLINNKILLTSYNVDGTSLETSFTKTNGFYEFDFTKVRGTEYQDSDAQKYCAGNGKCEIPKSQTEGIFAISFPDDVIRKSIDEKDKGYVVSLVTIGEDDVDRDCKHSNLDLIFDVAYVDP